MDSLLDVCVRGPSHGPSLILQMVSLTVPSELLVLAQAFKVTPP